MTVTLPRVMATIPPRLTVHVFGLHRSGTNFMEWVLANAFADCRTDRLFGVGNIPGLHNYLAVESLKHTLPTLAFCEFALIATRPFDSWSEAMASEEFVHSREAYDAFHHAAYGIDESKRIIVDSFDAWQGYDSFLEDVSRQFGLDLVSKEKPLCRFNQEATQTEQAFTGRRF